MSQGFPVLIARLKRSYILIFDWNEELKDLIKAQDNTKFNDAKGTPKGWVLPALSLYRLMLPFKGTGTYHWHWESEATKAKFITDAKKCAIQEREREEALAKLDARNVKMVDYKKRLKDMTEFKYDFTPFIKPGFKPFPHQKGAALWLSQAKSGILAAQMGLGKTMIYVMAMEIDPTVNKVLIICPNSLKLTLRDEEIHKFFFPKAFILNSKRKNPYPAKDCKYFITNYEYFASKKFDPIEKLVKFGIESPDVVVIDESHRIKEKSSNTYQNIQEHLAGVKDVRFIMSTGTPIKSASRELFTQLHLVNKHAFPSQDNFNVNYCGMKWDKMTKMWLYDRSLEKAAELNELIQPYMYRILKTEALDLPEKIFTRILIELSPEEQKTYDLIEKGVANEIFSDEQMDGAQAVTLLLRLQQYTALVKVKHLEEMITRMLEEGEKIVFLDRFKDTIYALRDMFPDRTVVHTGDQSEEQRQAAKLAFRDLTSGKDIFDGSNATCNAGLTLVEANKMFLNTMDWTPADCDQLYDRIHRIGQGEVCNYYLPIAKDTVDEMVFYSVESKRKVVERVVDNREHRDTSGLSTYGDVMAALKRKHQK